MIQTINISDLMGLFLTDDIIIAMGNWYPRVLAVMSCVVPFAYLLYGFALSLLLLYGVYRVVSGNK